MTTSDRLTGRHCQIATARQISILLAALLLAASASAQERNPFAAALEGFAPENGAEEGEEHLETDRDSFTPSTTVVGRGWTMIESSYSFIDNRDTADTNSLPELLTRIGLTDWFELRLGWNFESGGGGTVSGTELGGEEEMGGRIDESNILYGFKAALLDQNGWRPRSVVIMHANTPTSGPETATQFVAGYFFGWTLPREWQLDSGLRYVAASEEGDHFNQWAPSIVLKVPVGEHWNAHAEYFGIFSQNRADNLSPQFFSPGLHYLICPDCEVGVRVGWGLNNDAANFFSNVGLGVRF